MEKLFEITNNNFVKTLCGVRDKNIKDIERNCNVKLFLKSEGILIKGKKKQVDKARGLLERMCRLQQEGVTIDNIKDLSQYSTPREESEGMPHDPLRIKVASFKKKFVFPKTEGQQEYIKAIQTHDITFSIGPAGTGKTYLAMAVAVNYLTGSKVSRIILTRPAIEAGESLGFLPGTMHDKLGPYLRPLYDALYDMMEPDTIEEYLETGIIEIAPLAYMRGRTLNNAFVVLDEAQNCTSEQLKMFLTRLGFDSKTVITGDITQSDLPGGKPTGLLEALEFLKSIQGIQFSYLSKKDVVRHPLIQKIIQAYEDFYR